MSTLGLFVAGTLVTLLVTASMALLIWGAVLDGRDEHGRLEAEREAGLQGQRTIRVVDAA
jgi:hypothetical protein